LYLSGSLIFYIVMSKFNISAINACGALLLSIIATISCSPKIEHFKIDTNNVLYLTSPVITEVLFSDYLSENKEHGYLFIFTDAECSSCLFEIGWWAEFVKNHPKFDPIFIAKARYLADFLDHLNYHNYKFSVYHDNESLVFIDNKFVNGIEVVMTDNSLNILYKGTFAKGKKIKKAYKELVRKF